MIASVYSMRLQEIDRLPINDFRLMLDQAFNILSLQAGGEFRYSSARDDETELDRLLRIPRIAHYVQTGVLN